MVADLTIAGDGTPDWTGPIVHFFSVDDFHRLAAAGVFGPEDRAVTAEDNVLDSGRFGCCESGSGVDFLPGAAWLV